ncbi:uncharacterized protein LOC134068476 isoform X2 [Sardina pilchardus]|uniref:uncharacterized protein LOC134068476 isoform X2 n=1 Tax=Sardina pilchardus TaxID=27697 RepID=UPI002E0D4BA9
MHLFSINVLLLMGHVTTTAGQRLYRTEGEGVCPGRSFHITQLFPEEYLFFKSSIPGSSEKRVGNRTHIFLPSYGFKDYYIFIPEVMKQHEGLYTRSFAYLPQMSFPVVKLMLKDCAVRREVPYGEKFSLEVPKEASILEFTTSKSTDRRVLWSRINTDNKRGARGTVTRDRWEAVKITKADEGRYTLLKENGAEVSSTNLNVTELNKEYDLTNEDIERMKFPVPFAEAVLTFIDSSKNKHVLFQNAMMTDKAFLIFGSRLNLHAEYGELVLTIKDLKSSGKGQYEVRDKNKGLAVVLYVYDDSSESSNKNPKGAQVNKTQVVKIVSILCSVMWLLFSLYCLWKRLPPAASPAPVQPIHVHPYSEVAGSYSEPYYPYTPAAPWASVGGGGRGAAGGAGGAGGAVADTNPNAPSPPLYPAGAQYQGWGGGLGDVLTSSALSMDTSTGTGVYNSDKLNF